MIVPADSAWLGRFPERYRILTLRCCSEEDIRLSDLTNACENDLDPRILVSDTFQCTGQSFDAPAHVCFDDQSKFMRPLYLRGDVEFISSFAFPLLTVMSALRVDRVNVYYHSLLLRSAL